MFIFSFKFIEDFFCSRIYHKIVYYCHFSCCSVPTLNDFERSPVVVSFVINQFDSRKSFLFETEVNSRHFPRSGTAKVMSGNCLKGSQHFAYQPPLATVQGAAISNDETWQSFFVFLPSQRFTWNLKMARPAIGDSCWKNMVHLKMARPASRRFLLGNHHFLGFHDKPTWSVYTSPWWVLVRVDHPQNQFPTTWKEVFRKHSWSR